MSTSRDSISVADNKICYPLHLLSVLQDDIILCQPHNIPTDAPPAFLPPSIKLFISQAAGLPQDSIINLWATFKTNTWSLSDTRLSPPKEEPMSSFNSTDGSSGPSGKGEVQREVLYKNYSIPNSQFLWTSGPNLREQLGVGIDGECGMIGGIDGRILQTNTPRPSTA
ncbi:hypothetical protein K438DRAFT_1767655 [Mycena galopus ATCC 62051]|nr:hypothetical protein K438DRAFT_1767655 [Mycena galopus ATCC 62051]